MFHITSKHPAKATVCISHQHVLLSETYLSGLAALLPQRSKGDVRHPGCDDRERREGVNHQEHLHHLIFIIALTRRTTKFLSFEPCHVPCCASVHPRCARDASACPGLLSSLLFALVILPFCASSLLCTRACLSNSLSHIAQRPCTRSHDHIKYVGFLCLSGF